MTMLCFFQDLLTNIALVIAHFSSKVVSVSAGDGAAMMEIIEKEAIMLPTDRLAKFPELRFRSVSNGIQERLWLNDNLCCWAL